MSKLKVLFWAIFALTMGIYATMLLWSLPFLMADTGGLPPFDLRPTGYSFDDAVAMLSALSAEGTTFYRDIQLNMLDMAFPGLLAITLFLAFWLLTPASWGNSRWLLLLVALLGTIFDYLENFAIKTMLALGPNFVTPEIVANASSHSVSKASFVTASMILLLVLLGYWAWRKFSSGKKT